MIDVSPVALVTGAASSIGRELITGLLGHGIRVVLYDDNAGEAACRETAASFEGTGAALDLAHEGDDVVAATVKSQGRLDYLFNCLAPTVATPLSYIAEYPQKLHQRNLAAAQAMAASESKGAIVNQFFTGSLFAGSPLEAAIIMGKGAVTGSTRVICCAFGKAGIRINTLQAGLTELPENNDLVTPHTLARKPPVGRWATPHEVARFMQFLALRNGYMTGQVIVFDGGLTAGLTGT